MRVHGFVDGKIVNDYLTHAQYIQQLSRVNTLWEMPNYHGIAAIPVEDRTSDLWCKHKDDVMELIKQFNETHSHPFEFHEDAL